MAERSPICNGTRDGKRDANPIRRNGHALAGRRRNRAGPRLESFTNAAPAWVARERRLGKPVGATPAARLVLAVAPWLARAPLPFLFGKAPYGAAHDSYRKVRNRRAGVCGPLGGVARGNRRHHSPGGADGFNPA